MPWRCRTLDEIESALQLRPGDATATQLREQILAALNPAPGPREIGLDRLVERAREPGRRETMLALPVTLEGQTTAHTIAERRAGSGVVVTRLAQACRSAARSTTSTTARWQGRAPAL